MIMTQEDKYRQQAKVFLKRINEARLFFSDHNRVSHSGSTNCYNHQREFKAFRYTCIPAPHSSPW